jgi:hypothetical protein
VEFALIAPVLLVLLLVTVDFGRALYGWVVLQNSARVAANFAALNPDGWNPAVPAPNPAVKARYAAQITQDLQAANCTSFGSGGGSGTAPDPTFIDGPDQPDPAGPVDHNYDVGDLARVTLQCTFHPITPIVAAIVGNNFQLGASSEFRIRKGSVTGLANATEIPEPATPTPVPTATATATPVCTASTLSYTATNNVNGGHPHRMAFSATATPALTGTFTWTWTEGATTLSTGQSTNIDFPTSGSHTVAVTASNGSCVYTITQVVIAP